MVVKELTHVVALRHVMAILIKYAVMVVGARFMQHLAREVHVVCEHFIETEGCFFLKILFN